MKPNIEQILREQDQVRALRDQGKTRQQIANTLGMSFPQVRRRNWLFAGSDTGGEILARALTLIESAKMNGLDPQACLADLLDRIHDHKVSRLDDLLPWNWIAPAVKNLAA